MQPQRTVGIQWKLGLTHLATAAAATLTVAAGFLLFRHLGFTEGGAIGLAFSLGILACLAGSTFTIGLTRSIKVRLWELGELADRIGRGDFSPRLSSGVPDELGSLEDQLIVMASHLKSAVSDLEQLAEQNRLLAEEAGRGVALEERTRLARDLHDTVNQQLFALSMGIAAVRKSISRKTGDLSEFVDELGDLELLAREAHGQIRDLILQLRPVTLEQQGLGPALQAYAQRMADEEGWRLSATIECPVDLDHDVRENLFRLGQEALANIKKHAEAKHVALSLRCDDERLTLTIRDDGVGFDPRRPPRPTAVGLVGMKERMEAIHGDLKVESQPGSGTTITVQVGLDRTDHLDDTDHLEQADRNSDGKETAP